MDSRLIEIPAYAIGNQTPIRRFADSQLQESIDRAVSGLGDKHGTVIAHADGDGASLTVVAKMGEHWSIVAPCYRSWDGKLEGEVAVRYAW